MLYSQLKVNPVCCTLCLREGKVDPVFASKLGDVSNATRHLKRVHTEQWDEYDKKRKEAGLPAHTRVPAAAAARADASRAVSPAEARFLEKFKRWKAHPLLDIGMSEVWSSAAPSTDLATQTWWPGCTKLQ